jgi:hypothetical protein
MFKIHVFTSLFFKPQAGRVDPHPDTWGCPGVNGVGGFSARQMMENGRKT